jgi:hypothetical protein
MFVEAGQSSLGFGFGFGFGFDMREFAFCEDFES